MLHVISLGAGVQSTTMALMAVHGELTPTPDCAIFADTQWEPRAVYEHLRWLELRLPFPVHRVSAGNLRDAVVEQRAARTSKPYAVVPFFTADGGMAKRQCTSNYKIEPLAKKQRELLGFAPRQRIPAGSVEVWIGISLDEAIRMKPARERWQTNRWPLIEKQISRRDCLQWLKDFGYPQPPKSACLGCPYASDERWRVIRDGDPAEWADTVAVDEAIRKGRGGHQWFMHRSLKPLAAVDLRTPTEWGQGDLFLNECEGMCGV